MATVGRVRERFWRLGLDAALERSTPDRIYRRASAWRRAEARLIALARSEAPEGRDRWSMRLLADLACRLGVPPDEHGAKNGDDRDHRLRQSRPDGGEHAPHGPGPEVQPIAENLDRVREQRRSGEDRREG